MGSPLEQARRVLKQRFGHAQFRGSQEAVIGALLAGRSSLVIMPTGGKSLCYQLPAVLEPGLTLVISPLVALIKDQVDELRRKEIAARAIHSQMPREEREHAMHEMAKGKLSLIYATPERLRKPEFWDALRACPPRLLAIDEAHCISQWGTDFRPDYSRLGEWRGLLGRPPTLALTATATPPVQADILEQLSAGENWLTFTEGVERPNLHLAVEDVHGLDDKVRQIVALRHQHPGPAIVYFALISSLERMSGELRRLNIQHRTYHGQLDEHQRRQNQDAFISGPSDLILATPAFGLGIDKADIRLVIHAEVPGSIEAYYQEVGRAGRDSQPAHAVLLYDPDDVSIQMDFIKWSNPDPGFISTVSMKLKTNLAKFRAEGLDGLRRELNFYNSRDFRLETALNLLERWECIDWPHKNMQRIQWLAEPPAEFMQPEAASQKLKHQNTKLLELVRWIQSEDCRKMTIYAYFGVTSVDVCGFCQNCEA